MKISKILTLSLLAIGLLTANVYGQETKESKKETEKRLKEEKKRQKEELKQYKKMKPEAVKALKVGNDRLNAQISTLTYTRDSLTQIINSQQITIAQQDTTIKKLEAELEEAKKVKAMAAETVSSSAAISESKGIIYAVQLGAYRNFSLTTMPGKGVKVQSDEGLNKYILGMFRNVSQADAFRKEMQAMGVKDAWVVAFNNGKRIPREEAIKMQNGGGNKPSSAVEISE